MIEFEWSILQLTPSTVDGIADVVTQIHFVLIARDVEAGHEQGLHGSYTPSLDDIGGGIVPFAELTPEIVTAWLDAMPTAESYREQVTAALLQAVSPPPALPWAEA